MHGAGGNLLNFRDFSERLSPDQPVFGLEARGVDGQLPPAQSIEEMADLYLDAIRRQQPQDPICSADTRRGRGRGRNRQSAGRGRRTCQRGGLLDTFHPATAGRDVSLRDHFEGLIGEGLPYLRRHVNATVDRISCGQSRTAGCVATWRGRGGAARVREWHLATSFLNALKKYVPAPYAVK